MTPAIREFPQARKLVQLVDEHADNIGALSVELDEVENLTRKAIDDAASGGGFILRCASGVAGINSIKTEQQLNKMIAAAEVFIETGLKYGKY